MEKEFFEEIAMLSLLRHPNIIQFMGFSITNNNSLCIITEFMENGSLWDILHKQGRYFIVHFKELFLLDGKKSNLEENDVARRNTIATLMSDWGLLSVEVRDKLQPIAPLRQIKIISFKDKDQWDLCPKYNIGNGAK